MNRSDSTTGAVRQVSIRAGPRPLTGPLATIRPARTSLAPHCFWARITTSLSSRRPTGSRPVLSSQAARALQYRTERDQLRQQHFGADRGVGGRLDRLVGVSDSAHDQHGAAVVSSAGAVTHSGSSTSRRPCIPHSRPDRVHRTGDRLGLSVRPSWPRADWTRRGHTGRPAAPDSQLPSRVSTATSAATALALAQPPRPGTNVEGGDVPGAQAPRR